MVTRWWAFTVLGFPAAPIALGNLASFTYPNGLTHTYTYTEQNRLKTLNLTRSDSSLVRGYTYTLGPTGNRIGVAESNSVSGGSVVQRRRVAYDYDHGYDRDTIIPYTRAYRLSREQVFDPSATVLQDVQYYFDAVGNRTSRLCSYDSSFHPVESIGSGTQLQYNSRDQISIYGVTDMYDANGNSLADEYDNPTWDTYDAENHLVGRYPSISMQYDVDGNRASKSVGTTSTYFLLDDRNPSGYVQVLAEYSDLSNPPDRAYTYGHELIAQRLNTGTAASPVWSTSYYGFDGQSSVRLLTDASSSALVTDEYDYDAYGNLLTLSTLNSQPPTLNHYRYTGQQWDSDLGMYFQRARYYLPRTGRFWTADKFEGCASDPESLHKYSYCQSNPVDRFDPSGQLSSMEIGRRVHRYIGEHFVEKVTGGFSGPSVISILKEIPGFKLPAKFEDTVTALFPDLTDTVDRQVYEIKPDNARSIALGELQLEGYIQVFNELDPRGGWHRGTTYRPPLMIPVDPLTDAIAVSTVPGMIVYKVIDVKKIVKRKTVQTAVSENAQLDDMTGISILDSLLGAL